MTLLMGSGCAVAQIVSSRLPTAASRVQARVSSCGICGGQSGTWAGFLRVLRSPLPIRISPTAPQSSSTIIWGRYGSPKQWPHYQVESVSHHEKRN
jgi:hypothetical protein